MPACSKMLLKRSYKQTYLYKLSKVLQSFKIQEVMKHITIILKAMLLWVTLLSSLLFVSGGFESLVQVNHFTLAFIWLIINTLLYIICYHLITYKEANTLLGYNLLSNILYKKKNSQNNASL